MVLDTPVKGDITGWSTKRTNPKESAERRGDELIIQFGNACDAFDAIAGKISTDVVEYIFVKACRELGLLM